MENILNFGVPTLCVCALVFMAVCGNSMLFNNMYSRGCKEYGKPIHKLLGWLGYGVAGYVCYGLGIAQKWDVSVGLIVGGIAVPIGFAWFAWHGFNPNLASVDQ